MDTLPPAAALAALDHLPHVMTPNAQQFLKMEDLHSPPASSSSPPPSAYDHRTRSDSILNTSPAPVIVHSKPAKKRKSWGQELPEPKTTLPPRKRAKTEDEKEQRRIERIKRNRAAAHNSRERKRQETETLAVALARANAELEAYRRLHGPLPASVVLPEVTLSTDSADTPAPSLVESHGSIATSTSPQSLADCLFDIDTTIKQEPSDNTLSMDLTPAFNLNPKSQLAALDSTQHSAAMLCDLQCRSSSPRSNPTNVLASNQSTTWWSHLFLSLLNLQLLTCYKTMCMAVWMVSPSRMARMMQASTLRLTSRSTTSSTIPLQSRPTALAQLKAATSLVAGQGALEALQRQRVMDSHRASGQVKDQNMHDMGLRKALLKDQDSRANGQGNRDQNGGGA